MNYAYYNEHEPYAAEWLRNLIKAGLIAPGCVDERNIQDVEIDDLQGIPAEWVSCAPVATRSARRSRRPSSKP